MTAHNNVDDTYRALRSLLHQAAPLSFEVVLVDDGSTDGTAQLIQRLLGARTARFKDAQRYARANNFAVFNLSDPSTTFIWFLNNDLEMANTQVLTSLLALHGPTVGAVGGKLVLLSGKLQEAGSFIWRNGHTVGYGREGNPADSAYTYVRDVDYCSAANLLVRRSVFHALNGFDASTFPMYFEDTDLQMRIRYVANLSVLYQPLAVVNHREHASSSRREAQRTIKQARNTFTHRWMMRLLRHHYPSTPENILCAKNRRPGLRLLLIDQSVMDRSYGADFTRTYALLSAMASAGHMLTVFPFANKRRSASVAEFEQMGIEFCCFDTTPSSPSASSPAVDLASPILASALATFLRARRNQFDAIIVSHASVFSHALPVLKKEAGNAHIIFNAETFWWKWFLKKVELEAEQDATIWAEEEQRRRLELFLHCQQAWLLTPSDEELVRSLPAAPRLWLVQHGMQVVLRPPPSGTPSSFAARSAVGFAGVFRNPQDADAEAMIWFLDNVWRTLVKELSSNESAASFLISGASPPRELTVLAEQQGIAGRVRVIGSAADTAFYSALRVFVLPHQYGANLQNKIVEALAMGVPCVLMRQWAAPLALQERTSGVLLADDAKSMAAAVLRIWTSEDLWRELSNAAIESMLTRTNVTAFQESIAQSLAQVPRNVCKV